MNKKKLKLKDLESFGVTLANMDDQIKEAHKTNSDITLPSDDDQAKTAHKPKKKRKWIKKSKYQMLQEKKKREKVSVVFNYSKIDITNAMENVLNRGLNFAIMPLKLNLTQLLVEYQKFERTMLWTEFWANQPKQDFKPPIFKKVKTNLPRKHHTPAGLKAFLNGVKSEMQDPLNKNKCHTNLPPEEIEALKKLIQLQKERIITIRPCDKGAGIIILDFEEYMRSCTEHLTSTQLQPDGSKSPYYMKVNEDIIEGTKKNIKDVLEEAFNKEIITKEEMEAMDPTEKKPAKFYQMFKVHKKHEVNKAPPERPVISGSGSYTENISLYVEHHLKEHANKHPSYLQDSPDFLREIEKLNEMEIIEDGDILVSIDVSGLYTNIPQWEGLDAAKEALEERNDKTVPTDFLLKLLELVLKHNIFEFNNELFIQIIGTAMGTRPAPSYANIFMAKKIDPKIVTLAYDDGQENSAHKQYNPVKFFKRFLDDIFILFRGSPQILHSFIEDLNKIHPTIKFTLSHTLPYNKENILTSHCDCAISESLAFLDTACKIIERKIIVDLYRKPTDRNQYLLTNSCHPAHVTKNIPYSLALKIIRICTLPTDRDKRLEEVRDMLLERDYKAGIIEAAIQKAKKIDRKDAIKKVETKNTNRSPVFILTYDPRLPSVTDIVRRHWRYMVKDPYLAEVFKEPPLIAYKTAQNIKDKIIRAKVPPLPPSRQKRKGFIRD